MTATITLNQIRNHKPCTDGWKKLLQYLNKTQADDEPLTLLTVLDSNGLDDAIWCLRALPDDQLSKVLQFALCSARTVEHLMQDQRSKDVLDITERYLQGKATELELREAAARAAYAPYAAAYAARAAYAAYAAADAAYAAAYAAANAADAAAHAAYAAANAADAAANAAADAQDKIKTIFREMF
jgi:hypothetical protein